MRLQGAVYEAGVNKLNQDLTEIEEAISEMKGRVDEALGVLNDAKHEETNRLREAQDAMGNGYRWDKPPKVIIAANFPLPLNAFITSSFLQALTEQCRNWHCPDSPDAIEVILGEMKTQCECIEGVDPRIIRKYKAIQEESEELAKEIDKHVANTNARKGSIDEIRTRWLTGLGELVEG